MTLNDKALQALTLVSDYTPTGDSDAACHARAARREAVQCFLAGNYSDSLASSWASLAHALGADHPDVVKVRSWLVA